MPIPPQLSRVLVVLTILVTHYAKADELTPSHLFDFTHAELAISYLHEPNPKTFEAIAKSDAAKHLKFHSDHTGYYPKQSTELDITTDLLVTKQYTTSVIDKTAELLAETKSKIADQAKCLAEVSHYLPDEHDFNGKLFFTVGYDIGVSMGDNASLNLAHSTFHRNPKEIWYYCIHELHHVGFQHFNPFPDLHDVRSGSDLLALVKYLTFLEGSAVYAAWNIRSQEGQMSEHDYVALQDEERMAKYTKSYFAILQRISSLGDAPLTEQDWQLVDPLSDGDRLWYRVGALMSKVIAQQFGREIFLDTIKDGPDAFFTAYKEASN